VVGIAILGSIAGAVLIPAFNTAPVANKVLVSALGGVSRVANTAQNTMREAGLTSEEVIREREVIRARLESAIDDYTKAKLGNNPPAQEAAVIRMKSICIAYSILNPRPTAGSSTSSGSC
jgi:hypothetical protein